MKKLKEWLEKQIENMSDDGQFSRHHAGEKSGYKTVLAKIKKIEYDKQEDALKYSEKCLITFEESFNSAMDEYRMYQKSFERPTDFFQLSDEKQWEIDEELGIQDWSGTDLTKNEMKLFREHYKY